MNSAITKISDTLFLITLYPSIPGFNDFIGVWAHRGKPAFIVDVGPSVTAGDLVNHLKDLDIQQLDYIFLTHIHIDHAGGLGDLAPSFPGTPVICHKSGIPHLIDPENLWKGSVKTLGDTGRAYGRIQPVPENRLVDAETFSSSAITPIITPGHAPHHVSYHTDEYLFAGETGGVSLALPSGAVYLRPATPPKFFMDISVSSIDALISLNPSTICYGHFGARDNAVSMLETHRSQLMLWHDILKQEMKHYQEPSFLETAIDRLLKEDPMLQGFHELDDDVKQRERGFMENSVRGFAGYLAGKEK